MPGDSGRPGSAGPSTGPAAVRWPGPSDMREQIKDDRDREHYMEALAAMPKKEPKPKKFPESGQFHEGENTTF